MRKWIIMACLAIMPVLAYAGASSLNGVVDPEVIDTTAADTSNCLNLYKPYRIVIPPGSDSLVARKMLQDFADFLDVQVDEIYARVRDAVCDKLAEDLTTPCAFNIDTINTCAAHSDYCIFDDPQDPNNAKIVVNTKVLELSWVGPEADCSLDSMTISETILRWIGHNGDTFDLEYDGVSTSEPGPTHRIFYLSQRTMGGYNIWRVDSDAGASSPSNPSQGLDGDASTGYGMFDPYPLTGLHQFGIVTTTNTSMDRDTVIFATTWTNAHAGRDTVGGPVGINTNYEFAGRGFKYHNNAAYVVDVHWGVNSDAYAGDSLWVESKTDSSFIIGIKYSASARTFEWTTMGRWKTRKP